MALPTLGSIERMKSDRRREMYRLAMLLYPDSSAAEAYRTLRTNVEFASIDHPLQTLLVSSALPSEGKTITTANLAVALAQQDRRVLLVDADLRRPGIHEVFDLPNENGLTTTMRAGGPTLDAVIAQTESANLDVLTTGPAPPNPAELLGSDRMHKIIADMTATYDLVVFDCAPIQVVADAAILSSILDGVLLVVDTNKSRRESLREARQTLTRAGARVLGAVINGIKAPVKADYYDYYDDARVEPSGGVEVASAPPAAEPTTD